ncbi:MAG TPA: holo-ACP synthase [Candidatus Pelethenecus faecipullorum]|uniref:Holo-[acyl-carrier-protein] synthase n=1 Tax=Candidatus Pelethenecus faecipullorum TaxID=2840900 RepID=A0A9D1KIK8_9MOLU|nr:holo-ACP synthase [Candidatus Pelethenecus faecipullorum]
MEIGIDLVEHQDSRFEEERFIRYVLSPKEQAVLETITSAKRRIEYVASRFAAKEAVIKCLKKKISFQKITVLNDKNGAPFLQVESSETELRLSITHTVNYSVAVVISLP